MTRLSRLQPAQQQQELESRRASFQPEWLIYPTPVGACWLWPGKISKNGCGQVYREGRSRSAYRFVYEAFFGPVPEGLVLDHLCNNRVCVSPYHLEPVASVENNRRVVLREIVARLHAVLRGDLTFHEDELSRAVHAPLLGYDGATPKHVLDALPELLWRDDACKYLILQGK